jgi:osmotically-inducible protein OsmY
MKPEKIFRELQKTYQEKKKTIMKRTTFSLVLVLTMTALFLISISAFASETDERIESSAKQSYVFKTYLADDDIQIASKNGIVTLTGTVSEETHKSLAKETVSNLPGVVSVDNKLSIKNESPKEYSDAWLITKVKSTLLFHRNVSSTATEVFSKNGTVTLRGEADNEAQKDLTTEYALDVEGVRETVAFSSAAAFSMPRMRMWEP